MSGLPDEGKTWVDEVASRVTPNVVPPNVSLIVVPLVTVTSLQSAAINVAAATASVAELTMAATPRVRARVLRLLAL
jgi:hypothetical protein